MIRSAQGKYNESLELQRQVLRNRENSLGCRHLDVAAAQNNIGVVFEAQGKYAEKRVLGPEHCGTLVTAGNLAL